jgi:hypothetical protein
MTLSGQRWMPLMIAWIMIMNKEEWIDGLPLVGCECVATRGVNSRKFKIVYRGMTKKGEHIIEWDTGHVNSIVDDTITFYPIRTPEETERENAITEIVDDVLESGVDLYSNQEIAEELYDAGYRKIKELSDEDIENIASCAEHPKLAEIWMKVARDYMLGKEK